MRLRVWVAGIAVALTLRAMAPATAQSVEERLRVLEAQVAALKVELAAARGGGGADERRFGEIERRIEVLAAELERLRSGQEGPSADRPQHGLGPAASKVYRVTHGVSLGGYGELLYENFSATSDAGTRTSKVDQADFLRGVIYLGYKFDEHFLLNTEIEFEHASTGRGGEASVEFAYLDWLHRPAFNVRAGLLLLPVGLINELHEPTVFLSARRPGVEQALLPTTWRENGVGVFGDLGAVSYRSYVVTGLDASKFSAAGIRGGRQKGASAKAEDLAWVNRLDVTTVPGLLGGFSLYAGDSGQGLRTPAGDSVGARTTIAEAHVDWRYRGLIARALAARTRIGDAAALNAALGLAGAASVGERQAGGYLEVGYDVLAAFGSRRAALVPFARWETYDTQTQVPSGYRRSPANDIQIRTLGVSFKPIDQLVVKLDWQDVDNAAGSGVDQINVAVGYVF